VAKGLSAGRVQSVAVRLVADREREILAFKPQEYWEIVATVKNTKNEPMEFDARLAKVGDKTIDKMDIQDKGRADEILAGLEGAKYSVSNLETKETKRNPFAPFTTSTLQQSASKKFHMPSKFTMSVAQQLYEMGLITYHRTDSLNLSEQSLAGAQAYITSAFGTNYWAGHFVRFKTKAKLAQEAHEAIRPTDPAKTIDDAKKEKSLTSAQEKLYKLIWQRFVASQMAPAIFDSANVDILATPETASGAVCAFKATGQTLKFDGFLKVYPTKYEELSLPKMEKEEPLDLVNLASSQHFTKPPARYNEASLIKALEANGIGRPSTYAPTISTIQDRNYIEKDENRYFKPTETGLLVNDLLVQHFPQIVDIGFTAKMEEDFDEVAEGKIDWIKVLQNFYGPFAQNLANKEKEVANKSTLVEMTDKTCPKCGSNLVVKMGRFGKFYACPSYPTCKYTENIAKPNGGLKQEVKCPKCQTGNLVTKRTKKGKIFYGCSNYPNCDFALWDEPTGAKCEKCGSLMVKPIKGNEKCSNKDCETNKKP
jgi:DNA topoisomerase-1